MTLDRLSKSISLVAGNTIINLLITSLLSTSPVLAFNVSLDNPSFEDPLDFSGSRGWKSTGDTFIQNNAFHVVPVKGDFQILITTARHTENDDFDTPISTFNYSDTDPVTANVNNNSNMLQEFIGLSTGALSISRNNSDDDTRLRTVEEGSGIIQEFTFEFTQEDINQGKNILEINFNWAYLTNDSTDSLLGDQDFSFFTVYDTNSNLDDRSIVVLDSSDGNVSTPLGSEVNTFQDVNTTYYDANNLYTYQSSPFTQAGEYTYQIGFGVVDVDGLDRSSGLLIDNVEISQIPFKFSPSFGLVFVTGFWGIKYLRSRQVASIKGNKE